MKALLVLGAAAAACGADTAALLAGIEKRYNSAQSLQVRFVETYTVQGRRRPPESGELYLRKPGRMRWDYASPAGKLFVSDGRFLYYYSPATNRAEKMKLKETEDMRAPLAFLIGRLSFQEDFKEFRTREETGGILVTAIPRSDKTPFIEVTFLAAPDFSIRRLTVTGADRSVLEFEFSNERRNVPVDDRQFRFAAPPGAEFVDLSR
jgi:outer membrane lipoprotein carrier protein